MSRNLTVNGNTSLADNVTMSKNLTVNGNTILGSMGNDTIIGGNLTVNGNVTYNGTITHVDTVVNVQTLEVNESYIVINHTLSSGVISDSGLVVYVGGESSKSKSGLIRAGGTSSNKTGVVNGISEWFLATFDYDGSGNMLISGDPQKCDTLHIGGMAISSDERLKKDITLIDNALEKINKLKGVTYIWKDGHGSKEIGVIAQDIQAQFPELIYKNNDYLSVDYSRITAVLIEGVKELNKENKELRDMIKDIYEKLEQNKCKCEKMANNVVDVVDAPLAVAEEAPKRRGRKPKENASPSASSASSTTSSISSDSDEAPKRRGRKPKVVAE